MSVCFQTFRTGKYFETSYDICRHHHEKYDGRGYPDGLKGEEISIAAQLTSIADVYDALINKRVDKPPFSHEEAVAIIAAGRGTQFDPEVLDAFIDIEGVFRSIAARFPA